MNFLGRSVYALIRTKHKRMRLNTDFLFVNFVFSKIKRESLLYVCFHECINLYEGILEYETPHPILTLITLRLEYFPNKLSGHFLCQH